MKHFINPDNALFVLLSFEGPDIYSQAGGLGVRMSELSRVIAEHGFCNHLFFIGDPHLAGLEQRIHGRQILHRWCQWISRHHLAGVYDGEEGKLNDWSRSLPPFLIEEVVKPGVEAGRRIIILAEDWHTASAVQSIDAALRNLGIRDSVTIFWNVNNEFGFHYINPGALDAICTVTTVSRFMNRSLRKYGLDPLVIPNGIPRRIINNVDTYRTYLLKEIFDGLVLQKVGRYDPNKRWLEAISAVAMLKQKGANPHLIMRGSHEPHRMEVMSLIRHYGLTCARVKVHDTSFDCILQELRDHRHFDVLELDFFVPEYFLMLLYACSDAVLANSGYEPFGIVGLEVMAQGGVVILGNSGEDYASHLYNSLRLSTDDPAEIVADLQLVEQDLPLRRHLCKNALRTAKDYVWDNVLSILLKHVEDVAKKGNHKILSSTP